MFLRWKQVKNIPDIRWELKKWFGIGRVVATVFDNGGWYIWDRDGICIQVGLDLANDISGAKNGAEEGIKFLKKYREQII